MLKNIKAIKFNDCYQIELSGCETAVLVWKTPSLPLLSGPL